MLFRSERLQYFATDEVTVETIVFLQIPHNWKMCDKSPLLIHSFLNSSICKYSVNTVKWKVIMPQEPKKRHSRQRQGKRRASIRLGAVTPSLCLNCKNQIIPHTVCKYCGFYKGRQVKKVSSKAVIKRKEK